VGAVSVFLKIEIWVYEIPMPLRHLIVAYSCIATPPRTAEPPGVRHTRWYIRNETARGGSAAYHMRGMQLIRARDESIHEQEPSPATHPPNDGNGAAGVGGVADQRIRDTDYAPRDVKGDTTFYGDSISAETQRSAEKAAMSSRLRSSRHTHTRHARTRG
jgi:hypothetical protein